MALIGARDIAAASRVSSIYRAIYYKLPEVEGLEKLLASNTARYKKVFGPSIAVAFSKKPPERPDQAYTFLRVEEQDFAFAQASEIRSGAQRTDRPGACSSADGVSGDAIPTPPGRDKVTVTQSSDLISSPAAVSTIREESSTRNLKVLVPRRWPLNSKPEPVDAYIRTPPAQEKEEIAVVSNVWDIYSRQITSKLRRAPSALSFQLVTLPSAGPSRGEEQSRDYICVAGFHRWSQVVKFHAIVSKKENARLYRPLRLCYLLGSVDEAALSGDLAEIPRSGTLCGTPLLLKDSDGHQWVCTIGGLIEVGDQTFALTTKHRPPQDENLLDDNDDSEISDSDDLSSDFDWSSGEDDEDFDASRDDSAGSTGASHAFDHGDTKEDNTAQTSIGLEHLIASPQEISAKSGDDWELIPVEPAYQLPNIIHAEKYSNGGHPDTEWGIIIEGHVDMDSWKSKQPSVCTVTAILREHRLRRGPMWRTPSYLATRSRGVQQVWTMEFDGEDPKLGDSGSWVVEDDSRQLFGVVVARASGLGFVMPFDHMRQSIARSMGLHASDVRLPAHEHTEFRAERDLISKGTPRDFCLPNPRVLADVEVATDQPPESDYFNKISRLFADVFQRLRGVGGFNILIMCLHSIVIYVRVIQTWEIDYSRRYFHIGACMALQILLVLGVYFFPGLQVFVSTVLCSASFADMLSASLEPYGFGKQLIDQGK
ncbi:hypothetical protein CMUS01_12211 [Colletotrichum musicola]|uniref:Uncharacterized protein n=1 Tax=Colletotrichum musicola TaxID=2175873 RepID=A0A8H6JQA9_9PEZI|nr:hypothetical protein CMUS01_12211 [Colletotrichum musicola]